MDCATAALIAVEDGGELCPIVFVSALVMLAYLSVRSEKKPPAPAFWQPKPKTWWRWFLEGFEKPYKPKPPPTSEETVRDAKRKHAVQLAFIASLPLPPEEKDALRYQAEDALRAKIQALIQ